MVPDQFEESLDDHEKLLDLLGDDSNCCKFHCSNSTLDKFKSLVQDKEFTTHKVFHKERLCDLTTELHAPKGGGPNAQNEVREVVRKDEEKTIRNLEVGINDSKEGILKLRFCYNEYLSDDPKESPNNRGDLNDLDEQNDCFAKVERMALFLLPLLMRRD